MVWNVREILVFSLFSPGLLRSSLVTKSQHYHDVALPKILRQNQSSFFFLEEPRKGALVGQSIIPITFSLSCSSFTLILAQVAWNSTAAHTMRETPVFWAEELAKEASWSQRL